MHSFFLDTTDNLQVGLLNSSFEWIELRKIQETRNSARFHDVIHEVLVKNSLKIQEVDLFFQIAGPGNYTGIRLSRGVTNILELTGKDIYSFYHYQVPELLGMREGHWISKAYKGELFVYSWKENEAQSDLLSYTEFQEKYEKSLIHSPEQFFCHSMQSLYSIPSINSIYHFQSTSDLIERRSKEVFSKVLALRLKKDSFYYRPLEKEFRCANSRTQ